MGLFGFGKKKEWDMARVEEVKQKMRTLFNGVVKDGDTWKIVGGYALDIKTSNYIIARKTTYQYTSLIIGYREEDKAVALVQTTPDLDGCSEAEIFRPDTIKKAGMSFGEYVFYHQGGMMAGYTKFCVPTEADEKELLYLYQPEGQKEFEALFKKIMGK